jgi:iron complex outermembrane recepter protein
VSHFDITYTNRILRLITQGYFTNVVTNASQLGSLVNLNPSTSDVTSTLATIPSNQLFGFIGPYTPANIRAIADVGYVNASASRTKGVDVNLRYARQTAIGRISLDWANSILTGYDEQITNSLPQFEILDTIFNPTRFRSKMNIGWSKGSWSSNVRVNYVSAYQNAQDKSCGAGAGCGVPHWTTADLSMAYLTNDNPSLWFRGIRLALNVTNVANRSPPQVRIAGNNNLFYDPTNASPLGRAFAATITKRW